jgi:hypothetical protein
MQDIMVKLLPPCPLPSCPPCLFSINRTLPSLDVFLPVVATACVTLKLSTIYAVEVVIEGALAARADNSQRMRKPPPSSQCTDGGLSMADRLH